MFFLSCKVILVSLILANLVQLSHASSKGDSDTDQGIKFEKRGRKKGKLHLCILGTCSSRSAQDEVTVKMSNLLHAGTSGTIHIKFIDKSGKKSKEIHAFHIIPETIYVLNNFPRGENKTFKVGSKIKKLKNIVGMEIWQKSPVTAISKADYNPELITVRKKSTGKSYQFPISRWLHSEKHYNFKIYDTFLPRDDPFPKRREKELDMNRKAYAYSIRHELVSPLTMTQPPDESYSGSYTIEMGTSNFMSALAVVKSFVAPESFSSYKDMLKMFGGDFPTPKYANLNFEKDEWFALSRLQGANPGIIRLAKKIPEKFAVCYKDVMNLIEESSLEKAQSKKKLFIVDYWILKSLKEKSINVPAPFALFYLNSDKVLKPIAIQLDQEPSPDNPVFTPEDDNGAWELAKFWFQLADTSYLEAISHLGLCHYLMESVISVTHRTLAPSHPVFKILKPHFLFTIAANKLADEVLTSGDGCFTDKGFAIGCNGLKYLAGLGIMEHNFTRDWILPNTFREQKVTRKILPYYPYRDDILKIYRATKKYVSSSLRIYYKNDDDLISDQELLSWRKELSADPEPVNGEFPGEEDQINVKNETDEDDSTTDSSENQTENIQVEGVGIKGIPGDDENGFNNRNELIETVTAIIITASARHTAVNFNQYDCLAFPPNQPAILNAETPTDKKPVTKKQLLAVLPTPQQFTYSAAIARALSTRKTNLLGYFEVQRLYHPKAQAALKIYQAKLDSISRDLIEINKNRTTPYEFCDPKGITNSIPI